MEICLVNPSDATPTENGNTSDPPNSTNSCTGPIIAAIVAPVIIVIVAIILIITISCVIYKSLQKKLKEQPSTATPPQSYITSIKNTVQSYLPLWMGGTSKSIE